MNKILITIITLTSITVNASQERGTLTVQTALSNKCSTLRAAAKAAATDCRENYKGCLGNSKNQAQITLCDENFHSCGLDAVKLSDKAAACDDSEALPPAFGAPFTDSIYYDGSKIVSNDGQRISLSMKNVSGKHAYVLNCAVLPEQSGQIRGFYHDQNQQDAHPNDLNRFKIAGQNNKERYDNCMKLASVFESATQSTPLLVDFDKDGTLVSHRPVNMVSLTAPCETVANKLLEKLDMGQWWLPSTNTVIKPGVANCEDFLFGGRMTYQKGAITLSICSNSDYYNFSCKFDVYTEMATNVGRVYHNINLSIGLNSKARHIRNDYDFNAEFRENTDIRWDQAPVDIRNGSCKRGSYKDSERFHPYMAKPIQEETDEYCALLMDSL